MIKATEESCDKTKLSGHYYYGGQSSLTLQYLSAKRACVVDRESASRTRALRPLSPSYDGASWWCRGGPAFNAPSLY